MLGRKSKPDAVGEIQPVDETLSEPPAEGTAAVTTAVLVGSGEIEEHELDAQETGEPALTAAAAKTAVGGEADQTPREAQDDVLITPPPGETRYIDEADLPTAETAVDDKAPPEWLLEEESTGSQLPAEAPSESLEDTSPVEVADQGEDDSPEVESSNTDDNPVSE